MLGEQIIKGMAVTAKNFFGSYVSKERLTTVEYPEVRLEPKENTRQFPFLVYDGDDAEKGLRCVACQICEKECPPQCIYIVKSKDKKPDYKGQMQVYPVTFDIDISVCMSCSICVEVCPFESIKMDTEFELSTDDRFDGLLWSKKKLAKPNSHYHSPPAGRKRFRRRARRRKSEGRGQSQSRCGSQGQGRSGSQGQGRSGSQSQSSGRCRAGANPATGDTTGKLI